MVPLAWGTYTPVVKYLYEIQPPVPGLLFSAAYYALAAVTLIILASQSDQRDTRNDKATITGGIELGSYLFVGNLLQIVGLQSVPADRAGFLVQMTTVMVPILQGLMQGTLVSLRTWGSCLLALGGAVEISQNDQVGKMAALQQGDVLILLAAVMYSLHVVRLGSYAPLTEALPLAAAKASWEAILSTLLVLVLLSGFVAPSYGHDISSFVSTVSTSLSQGAIPAATLGPALLAVVWTGWITCAFTIYAQSFGQQRVSPVEANLIYTAQPLCTALVAFGLLGETLSARELVGASMIAAAVYSVAASPEENKMK